MNSITRPGDIRLAERRQPTRASGIVFAAKAAGLRLWRRLTDGLAPLPRLAPLSRLATDAPAGYPVLLAESVTPLWSDPRLSETRYQFGKVENLRRAAAAFDGLALPAGGVFSFWKQLGKPSRRRGFVDGRMLREGCLVPSIGGGLCQISNALYDLALQAGAEIIERHAHSRIVPGSLAAFGRDATVAWNYVDLRFRMPQDALLRARLGASTLTLQLYGRSAVTGTARQSAEAATDLPVANDCGSCGETGCFRHERATAPVAGRTAFLLDEAWPEFRAYVGERRARGDILAIPLDGKRWNRPRYTWMTEGYGTVVTATLASLTHAFLARHAAANGARVVAQLRRAEAVARRLGRALAPDATEVCVAQSLLPFLSRAGLLGGRRITVLMTRLPMAALQAKLDAAAAAHPERATLADFRAPADLVAAEAEALAAAERIVTPHAEIAALFPGRAERLDWRMPEAAVIPRSLHARAVAFPGPSLARKGAHELRAAALHLGLDVVLLGSTLEGEAFWHGLSTRPADAGWRSEVAAVVQPALVEEQPRTLLAALAAGIPVIATPACGIAPRPGLTLVPAGDTQALVRAIAKITHTGH